MSRLKHWKYYWLLAEGHLATPSAAGLSALIYNVRNPHKGNRVARLSKTFFQRSS